MSTQNVLKRRESMVSIILTAHETRDHISTVRIERQRTDRCNKQDVQYVAEGPFTGIIINRSSSTNGLQEVSKPHVKATFFAFVQNQKNEEDLRKREKREVRFWFYRNTDNNYRISQATDFFKLLIEPETFPRGYVEFIKKLLMLTEQYRALRRVEVCCQASPEPEPQKEEWELFEQQPIVYDYQYLPEVPVSKKDHVVFRVRAAADAHIALSNVYGDTERRTYEIVLGGFNNSKSLIRFGGQGPVEAQVDTPQLLDAEEFKSFWITWDNNRIRVGSGNVKGESILLQWLIPTRKLHTVNLMSVSTGPGSDGQWEFVEYLERVTPWSDSRPAKRRKVQRALLWYAKKTKMLESLEDAFPNSLDTKELLRLSTVSLAEMLEAVVFLKDLQKNGLVLEISRGVWLRGPVNKSDQQHETQMVIDFPVMEGRESPIIAVITSLFTEKVAVDSMLEKKVSYIQHSMDEGTRVYTLGKIGDQKIVSVKLPRLRPQEDSVKTYTDIIGHLTDTYSDLRHVFVIGVGGAVPDYADFSRHVRRGDIVVSSPRTVGGTLYIHCQDVHHPPQPELIHQEHQEQDQRDDNEKSGLEDKRQGEERSVEEEEEKGERREGDIEEAEKREGEERKEDHPSYSTAVWSATDDFIQGVVRQLTEYTSRGYDRPAWEKYILSGQELLCPSDSSFHRPPAKTDKLFALLDGEDKPVLIRHPQPPADKQHLYKDNQPNVRLGPIASGKVVAHNPALRMEFAASNGDVVAYDRGMHHLVEALAESKLSSYVMVLGISDYVDGSKGRTWQPYAALSAAAYMKTLTTALVTFGRRRGYFH